MHRVRPTPYIIGETHLDGDGLDDYFDAIGAVGWSSDAPSDVEELIEIEGRGCYMAFSDGKGGYVNPNVMKIREGNSAYIKNIVASRHGSVTEHSFVNFMFTDVSRVLTQELIRHRVGVAISEQSLRYVRLSDLGLWIPSCFAGDAQANDLMEFWFNKAIEAYELLLCRAAAIEDPNLAEPTIADFEKLSFAKKKIYTSAARRVIPMGAATNIGWSCNMRTLRHVIEMRTHPTAEEEIRLLFSQVAEMAIDRWPNLFGDYECDIVDGVEHYYSQHNKI